MATQPGLRRGRGFHYVGTQLAARRDGNLFRSYLQDRYLNTKWDVKGEKVKSEKVNFMLFQYLSQMTLWIEYDGLYIIRYAREATTYFIITLYISYDL